MRITNQLFVDRKYRFRKKHIKQNICYKHYVLSQWSTRDAVARILQAF